MDDLQNKHYILREADTCEGVVRFALPPSCVAKVGSKCYAIWLLADEPPQPTLWVIDAGGKHTRILHERPDLCYTYADFDAATRLPDDIVRSICETPEVRANAPTRALEVITALQKVEMSQAAIQTIFAEQPIGDPYREHCSLLGSLTLIDEFVRDIVEHHEAAGFIATMERTGTLRFSLASALRWWYPYRRAQGLRILPKREMMKLLKQNIGVYVRKACHIAHGDARYHMWGIELEEARKVGVLDEVE